MTMALGLRYVLQLNSASHTWATITGAQPQTPHVICMVSNVPFSCLCLTSCSFACVGALSVPSCCSTRYSAGVLPCSHIQHCTCSNPSASIIEIGHQALRTQRHQVRCAALKSELRGLLTKAGVKSFRLMPVKRAYAWESAAIPRGEQWCMKVR
jgi:hypothetical protein